MDEIEETFVSAFPDGSPRREIFEGWLAFRNLVGKYVSVRSEFVDGSFVTSKPNPGDLDLSVWVDADELNGLSASDQLGLGKLWARRKSAFHCDAFIVPECAIGHPNYGDYQQMLWTDGHWRSVRGPNREIVPGVTKGYLKVVGP